MNDYESQVEVLTHEILANWWLAGVKAVYFQKDHGDRIVWPLLAYDPDQVYDHGYAVEINEREAFDAAAGVDGMVFYVSKDKIII